MPRLPKLPDPENIFSAIDKAGDVVGRGISLIDGIADKIDRLAGKMGPESKPTETAPQEIPEASSGASNETTLKYQLDKLRTGLRQLEIHLSEGCRIDE